MRSRRVDRVRNTPPTPQGPFDDAAKNESPAKSQQGGITGGVTRGGQATGSCVSESVPLVFPARNCDQRRLIQDLGWCARYCVPNVSTFNEDKKALRGSPHGLFMEGASHEAPLETKCSSMPSAGPINNPYGFHRTGRGARCGQVLSFGLRGHFLFCAASRFCLTGPQHQGILTSILRSESQSLPRERNASTLRATPRARPPQR